MAQFQALFANANRDSKSKPFSPEDFQIYKPRTAHQGAGLTPATGAALIALHADGLLHPLLMACWADALSATSAGTPTPAIRALANEERSVWVIAPEWEGDKVRALVCVTDYIHGPVLVRDIDRRLVTHTLQIPRRDSAPGGWIEAGHLLVPAT